MRAIIAVAALLLAGCASPSPSPDGTPTSAPDRLVYAPDCGIATVNASWPEPCVARASWNPSPGHTEVDVAVDPTDPRNVVVSSKDLDRDASTCVWAVPHVSHDGGRTWRTVYIGGKASERKPGDPLYGWTCVTDPIMAFDAKGVLYYTLQAYAVGQRFPVPTVGDLGSAMFLARSKDGGDTWDKIIPLHAGDGTLAVHDYIRMTTNPKTLSVHSTWNQVGGLTASTPVVVSSRDGGETAGAPVYVPNPARVTVHGQTGIAAARDGTVFLMMGGGNAGSAAYLSVSTDDARSFTPPRKLFDITEVRSPLPNAKFRVGTYVELAVDQTVEKGCLHAVWTDGRAGRGDADILASRSCDGGGTWSDAVRVNRDLTKSDQFMTRVSVDGRGTVHVAYLTRAYDPANRLLDAEHAYSTDGGATWTTRRLTTSSFDGDLGIHQDGFPFIGDYLGIASAGDRTYAAFPHTVTGAAEIAVVALAPLG